jgi:hypothetical protein
MRHDLGSLGAIGSLIFWALDCLVSCSFRKGALGKEPLS